MSLSNAILELYPTAKGVTDYAFQQNDDGSVSLVHWNAALGPAPTIDALRAIEPEADRKTGLRLQIAAIEATITPRRMREALLTAGGAAWLAAREAEIDALREQLTRKS